MAPDLPGIPSANRRQRQPVEPMGQPRTVRIEAKDEPPVSTNPLSLFPAAEAAKAKVTVSLLLLLVVPAITYWVGSNRHEAELAAVKVKLEELKTTNDTCAKATRVEELLTNLSREQATTGGRVMQMNGDMAVIYSHVTGERRRAGVANPESPTSPP
jgi:hypothetical protein